MSNFFVNIPDASGSDAAGDLLFPSHGSIGVATGQTSGTDERPSMLFVQSGALIGNIFGLNPPYGYNNSTLAAGLTISGNNSSSATLVGASNLFNMESLAFCAFPKNAALSIIPAFVALNDTSTDVYFSKIARFVARVDLIKFGGDGSLSLLGGDLSVTGTATLLPPAGGGLVIGGNDASENTYSIRLGDATLSYFADIDTPTLTLNVGSANPLDLNGALHVQGNINCDQYGYFSTIVAATGYAGTLVATPQLFSSANSCALVAPAMTTAQKNAMTGMPVGSQVLDTDLDKLCFYGSDLAWHVVTSV